MQVSSLCGEIVLIKYIGFLLGPDTKTQHGSQQCIQSSKVAQMWYVQSMPDDFLLPKDLKVTP